ncbi:MAG: methyltransferase domain-containing protein [Nanoarchaeota archaeon]|nr:methyltransferase domain-containing protein [Nanoarchaeota archaeon]
MTSFSIKDVEKHYDTTLDYDEINDKTPSHNLRFIDGLKMSNLKNGAKILNVFCRSGKVEEYYNKKRKNLKFDSMDVSDRLLKESKKRFKKAKVKSTLKKFTTHTLPYKKNTFDNITSYETLEHVPKPGKLISEFSRVLKKGGELILSTPNTSWDWIHEVVAKLKIHHPEGPHRMVPRKEIIRHLKKAGFQIRKEKTVILVPVGPKILRKIGNMIEKIGGEPVRTHICLRRYVIATKK